MNFPAVIRLEPEQQAQVDHVWHNMLTPPNRLDHDLLLDVVFVNGLHAMGVDRVHYVAEKETSAGRVTMTVDFDRQKRTPEDKPDSGQFTFVLTSPTGHVLRREHYTGDDVLSRGRELFGQPVPVSADPLSAIPMISITAYPTAIQNHHALENRHRRIIAATQPIVVP